MRLKVPLSLATALMGLAALASPAEAGHCGACNYPTQCDSPEQCEAVYTGQARSGANVGKLNIGVSLSGS